MDVRIRPLTKQETLSRSSEWFLSGGEGGHSPQCPPDHISHTGRSSQVSRQHMFSPRVYRRPHLEHPLLK